MRLQPARHNSFNVNAQRTSENALKDVCDVATGLL